MLLQTNAYSLPRDKKDQHARLVKRFEDCFRRLGASFEVYQQVDAGFKDQADQNSLRFVQLMKFKDEKHLASVRAAEVSDAACTQLIKDFCELIDYSGQVQSGLFLPGYYASVVASQG